MTSSISTVVFALSVAFLPASALAQPQPKGGQPKAAPAKGDEKKDPAKADDKKDDPLLPAAGGADPPKDPPAAPPKPEPAKGDKKDPAVAVDPDKDKAALENQAKEREGKPSISPVLGQKRSDVFAEDWWTNIRPTFEFHGYFRTRAETFIHFALNRKDAADPLWPQPIDNSYTDISGNNKSINVCERADKPIKACSNNVQSGANMRFRLNPELHISDNLRVIAQLDLFDNLVFGSTPDGYNNIPAAGGGYRVVNRGGYTPTGAFVATQVVPQAGVNNITDSISVKRIYGEYMTPIGLLRFGRMANHWGLGILANAGDGYDSDWQSNQDRLMFVTGIKQWDLYAAAAWDFPNEGPIGFQANQQQGQAYDLAQTDDVNQWTFAVVRRRDAQEARRDLAKGKPVINGGAFFVYRNQIIANDVGEGGAGNAALYQTNEGLRNGYVRRGAEAFIPDLWFQFMYQKFRFEFEAVAILGTIENTESSPGANNYVNGNDPTKNGWQLAQFGIAAQAEYRLLEDKLRLQLGFGYASGDEDVEGLAPASQALDPQKTNDRTFSTFRFHPDYRIDLILWRNIMTRVQGAYYFRPSIDYDFQREKNGQRIGGGAAAIWSRASEFMQTPGNNRDLGIELNFQLYYQSKDGALNDDPDRMGGFYTMVQYGVLFPLPGLGYLQSIQDDYKNFTGKAPGGETAHIVRWYLGVLF